MFVLYRMIRSEHVVLHAKPKLILERVSEKLYGYWHGRNYLKLMRIIYNHFQCDKHFEITKDCW